MIQQNHCQQEKQDISTGDGLTNAKEWQRIIDFLLKDEEGKKVHKMIWDGFAYLSFPYCRHKIDESWTLEQVKELIKKYR